VAASAVTYDVVVVGGGAAGLAAAIAAAGAGARTALVERYGFLGGMATAGMVSTICGLYHNASSDVVEPINDGFAEAFARRLTAKPGCAKPLRRGRSFVLPYTPFAFACLADELVEEAAPLDVYLHAFFVGVETRPRRIETLRIVTGERALELGATVVVDTSGDGVVARAAGAETDTPPPAERQLPSLIFVMQHVDVAALGAGGRVAVLRALLDAERAGLLPTGAANVTLAPSPQPSEVVGKLALGELGLARSETRDFLTVAEVEGRRRVLAVTEFLKTLPAFARAFVSHVATQVGIREGRRIIGRYELTREDVLSGRTFDDAVARGGWPIELWHDGHRGATYEYLADGLTYDIPLRSLRARDLDNLFMAGRCMSASHEALGSARVIGTCLATGEAVGRIAARMAAGEAL
jgi:hypothetical protein